MSAADLDAGLQLFENAYYSTYRQRMMQKLGFSQADTPDAEALLVSTLEFLQATQVGYHDFFAALRQSFSPLWHTDAGHILSEVECVAKPEWAERLEAWRQLYHGLLTQSPESAMPEIAERLRRHNPLTVPVRPEIERVWEAIATTDNWQPFYDLLKQFPK